MKVALIQPNPINKAGQTLAYASATRPPETGLAVLACYLEFHSRKEVEITVLDPSMPKMQLAYQLASADIAGFSDWFSNHLAVMRMVRLVKAMNPNVLTVIGGPNAAMFGEKHLNRHLNYLDHSVGSPECSDGEETLLGLVEGRPQEEIPNLRDKGWFHLSYSEPTDLRYVPVWDFRHFQNLGERLKPYLDNQESDPWQVAPLAVESSRGCPKASRMGRCEFCTSVQGPCRTYTPMQFWSQVYHLVDTYHAKVFYIADNIFVDSLERMEAIARHASADIPARLRAYGYLPYLAALENDELARMVKALQKIGVFNLFFGLEHTDEGILQYSNKEAVKVARVISVMNTLGRGGIKSTLAFLPGLPGETHKSLRQLQLDLQTILKRSKYLERLYISKPVPFIGTAMWDWLTRGEKERSREYEEETGKRLETDDDPDYYLLARMNIDAHQCFGPDGVNADDVDLAIKEMVAMARQYIPEHRIGGFMLD